MNELKKNQIVAYLIVEIDNDTTRKIQLFILFPAQYERAL